MIVIINVNNIQIVYLINFQGYKKFETTKKLNDTVKALEINHGFKNNEKEFKIKINKFTIIQEEKIQEDKRKIEKAIKKMREIIKAKELRNTNYNFGHDRLTKKKYLYLMREHELLEKIELQ